MKIAVLCDLHLPMIKTASQYYALEWALQNIEAEKPDLTVIAGDITAAGDIMPMKHFIEGIKKYPHMLLLGNADTRNEFCYEDIKRLVPGTQHRTIDNCEILGINTPDARIEENDRLLLEECKDGAVIFAHHYPDALEADSREFLKEILSSKKLLYIHGHKHIEMESQIGDSVVLGVRGLDPDKAKGVPCVSYFELSETEFNRYERCFELSARNMDDFKDYLGISCFSPEIDIEYAINRGIKNIEIRKYSPEAFDSIIKDAERWRKHGGKYLSVHMPNLRLRDGKIQGVEEWDEAITLCNALEPDGVTIHVPRASCRDMIIDGWAWRAFLEIMTDKIANLPKKTRAGIENIHMPVKAENTPEREFGCVPEECLAWIRTINDRFGFERVGSLLDVGHASNNSVFNTRYTRSVWYEMLGAKTVAYHIHQVSPGEKGLINHNAIEDWFGPKISYFSFWWAWQNNHINHAPMFLEVKNQQNCEVSLKSFEEDIYGKHILPNTN